MAWIEALQRNESLWIEFKEHLQRAKQRELEKVLTTAPELRDTQIGIAKGLQLFLDEVTTKEREANARVAATRTGRSTTQQAGIRLVGFRDAPDPARRI